MMTETDFAEEVRIVDEGRAAGGDVLREIIPAEQTAEIEEQPRNAVGRNAGDAAEDDDVDGGGDDRLEQMPERAEDGLLVAGNEIALDEQIEQVAVFPEFAPTKIEPSVGRLDDDLVFLRGSYFCHDQHST
jgi:hypothetical protein